MLHYMPKECSAAGNHYVYFSIFISAFELFCFFKTYTVKWDEIVNIIAVLLIILMNNIKLTSFFTSTKNIKTVADAPYIMLE